MKKFFHRIFQAYGDLKLQTKFTLALMLAVTLPMLMLALFFYSRLYEMTVSYTIRQEQDSSSRTAPLIEETVQEVLDAYTELTESSFYETLFHMPVNDTLTSLAQSPEAADFKAKTEKLIDGKLITDIQIYLDIPDDSSGLFTESNTSEIIKPIRYAKGTYWYGIFQSNAVSSSGLFCPSFYLGTQEQQAHGDLAYIRSGSMYLHGESYPCYTAVYYSSEPLLEILSENLALEGSVSYIMNERNTLVASSDESLSGIYWLDYETIQDSFMSSNNFIERTILDEKIYAGFYNISQPGWYMVTVLPSAPLLQQSHRMMMQYILLYIVFLILALGLASTLARSITKRISSVIDQMQQVRQGPPVPMDSPKYHDEVGNLIDTYNYMTRKMGDLMEEQRRAAEDLRIAEFNSLQAQINPHFLYNTMDMINWLAQQGRTSEVSSAVQDLSRFYKLTLSRRQSISTIAQEEEHVSIYIRLQNMRYHDNIEFVSDIPDELMEYQIPKLTLQPVIENAILHGILEKDSKSGTIVLTGWMEDEDIVLLISDDGVGISPEKLDTILSGTGKSSSGGTNIAVYNTHRRFQILYGSKYGLSYSSEHGRGTEVQIRIPAQKEFQSPYLRKSRAYQDTSLLPLASVSSSGTGLHAVSPEALLDYSKKMTKDLYHNKIQAFHQIFWELPQNENFYILTHELSEDFPKHTHDYFELSYVCSGSLVNVVDDHEIYMEAGDLVFMNRNAEHSLYFREEGTLLVNFCVKPGFFDRTLKDFYQEQNLITDFFHENDQKNQNYIFFPLGNSLQAQSILTSIIQEYANNGFHQSFALESYFLLLFVYLANTEEFSYYGIDSRTHQMIRYLQSHWQDKPLSAIARHFKMTPEELDHYLKRHTGRNCSSFIRDVRLEYALKLLENPDLKIYQIAQECGYHDTEEFFEHFRRKFHISPAEYRNQFL